MPTKRLQDAWNVSNIQYVADALKSGQFSPKQMDELARAVLNIDGK